MLLTSTSIKNNAMIPTVHTCDGQDQSPALAWQNLPVKTKSLALIMDDPDAPHGTFVHWVAWNIDPKTASLPSNADASTGLFVNGTNSASKIGYHGPCPPSGTHRYFFKLYALDTKLALPSSTTKEDLLRAMAGHIVGQAELMGRYQRTK